MARLDPVEGSEQAGIRPVILVSRDVITASSSVVVAVPCTTHQTGRHIYPTQVLLHAPDGGLTVDSLALCEQVRALAKKRLLHHRGTLSPAALARAEAALRIALDL
jgi:mRNA interferase MazF